MKKIVLTFATAAALAMAVGSAQAGGWGKSSWNNGGNRGYSSGLLNVSPSIGLGDVNLLNGLSVLSGSPILSGNVVSGILSGNKTGVGNGILGNGILNGGKVGIFGGNRYKMRRHGRH